MRILVTGAGGFIGRALVSNLSKAGHFVLAADNNIRGNLNALDHVKNIEPCLCDVTDAASLDHLVKGVDAVYHLAYINGTKYFYSIPDKILEIGIIGTHNVLKSVLKHKVKNFFLASSSEAYQLAPLIPTPENVPLVVPDVLNPRYSYGGGKIASELLTVNYLRNAKIHWVIFRPHNVYGPQMGFEHVIPELTRKINAVKEDKSPEISIQGQGEETRSFIFIDDAIDAILKCTLSSKSSDGIYHIGTMEEVKINTLVQSIAEILGVKVNIKSSNLALGSTPRRCPDNRKIVDLGFVQKNLLRDGLKTTVSWYQEYYQTHKKEIL